MNKCGFTDYESQGQTGSLRWICLRSARVSLSHEAEVAKQSNSTSVGPSLELKNSDGTSRGHGQSNKETGLVIDLIALQGQYGGVDVLDGPLSPPRLSTLPHAMTVALTRHKLKDRDASLKVQSLVCGTYQANLRRHPYIGSDCRGVPRHIHLAHWAKWLIPGCDNGIRLRNDNTVGNVIMHKPLLLSECLQSTENQQKMILQFYESIRPWGPNWERNRVRGRASFLGLERSHYQSTIAELIWAAAAHGSRSPGGSMVQLMKARVTKWEECGWGKGQGGNEGGDNTAKLVKKHLKQVSRVEKPRTQKNGTKGKKRPNTMEAAASAE
ncbi:hypothetical protein JOM56_012556 [Amanita muscaria]